MTVANSAVTITYLYLGKCAILMVELAYTVVAQSNSALTNTHYALGKME